MNSFKHNILSADFWLRVVYTLLFALAWQVIELLLSVILVLQLGFRLFTGEPHARLAGFGNSLAQYAWQIGRYVTGAGDEKPWPFMEWPAADAQWQYKAVEVPLSSAADAGAAVAGTPASTVDVEPEPPILQPADDLDEPGTGTPADDRPAP